MRDHKHFHYGLITLLYWLFTLSDGALRMLVLLYFHQLGFDALQIASLFLFYEVFGIVTNLAGGWIAAHTGLRLTLFAGLGLQVIALAMLGLMDQAWSQGLLIVYVMVAQALSGIAKDLTKMSAKSGVKLVVESDRPGHLYHWVALLTGSKNALKGLGFFLGGLLLSTIGFQASLFSMAAALLVGLLIVAPALPGEWGQASRKPTFKQLFSKSHEINQLSAARFFLFAARDVWFVVGLPLYLAQQLDWSPPQVSGWLATWVIGYGIVQAMVPRFIRRGQHPHGGTALKVLGWLILSLGLLLALLQSDLSPALAIFVGLALFGIVFAINSAIHSYLILAYAEHDGVTLDVGFYYMANAAGRLLGTILSGLLFTQFGLTGCLLGAVGLLLGALAFSLRLPRVP